MLHGCPMIEVLSSAEKCLRDEVTGLRVQGRSCTQLSQYCNHYISLLSLGALNTLS